MPIVFLNIDPFVCKICTYFGCLFSFSSEDVLLEALSVREVAGHQESDV